MKTKILKAPLTILVLIFTFSNCSDSSISAERKKHVLTLEQTLELKALSANLKSTFAQENFFSKPVELPPNVLDHPVMQNFTQRIQHEKK
ncbi:MAG: hypothetical protein O9262_05285 [Cyclobacteriaceae bacterium]|nr:hypothetical protein [Cyclobacteriaceae bacterium]